MSDKKPERILIANDAKDIPFVLATDGSLCAFLLDEFDTNAEDMGIDVPSGPGIFLFTGYGKYESYSYEYPNELDLVWDGELRRVKPEELEELLAMQPEPTKDED